MGDLIPTNIDDFIEYFLRNSLQVDILDYQKVESGGEGYTIIYVSGLSEIQTEVLESIGFEQIKDDLWIFYGFEVNVDKLRDSAIWYFEDLQRVKWMTLIKLRCYIDNSIFGECRVSMFNTTHESLEIAFKWFGTIAIDELSFRSFVIEFAHLFLEDLRNDVQQAIKDIFGKNNYLNLFRCLRNCYAHKRIKENEENIVNEYVRSIVGVNRHELSEWHQFLTIQIQIIDDCINFLRELLGRVDEIVEKIHSKT